MDFVFCARNIRNGAFGTDPGTTRFLAVPETAPAHTPDHAITRRQWFDAVLAAAKSGTNPATGRDTGDVVIYVHGFNTELQVMLERHRLVRKGLEALGFQGVVASFDWPCGDSALNYLDDRVNAKLTALRLVTDGIAPFSRFIDQGCEINVHILAHSMGCFVVREAFDDADDRRSVAATGWTISQVMLCAADVSAESMGNSPKSSSLYRHCVRLTNYWNPHDAILAISNVKRVGVSPRAGRIGLPDTAPAKAVNVNCGTHFDEHREDYANVPNADHSWFFYDKMFLRDVYLTVKGETDRAYLPTREMTPSGLVLKD